MTGLFRITVGVVVAVSGLLLVARSFKPSGGAPDSLGEVTRLTGDLQATWQMISVGASSTNQAQTEVMADFRSMTKNLDSVVRGPGRGLTAEEVRDIAAVMRKVSEQIDASAERERNRAAEESLTKLRTEIAELKKSQEGASASPGRFEQVLTALMGCLTTLSGIYLSVRADRREDTRLRRESRADKRSPKNAPGG